MYTVLGDPTPAGSHQQGRAKGGQRSHHLHRALQRSRSLVETEEKEFVHVGLRNRVCRDGGSA